MTKPKKVKTPAFTRLHQCPEKSNREALEHFAGRKPTNPVHGYEGCALELEAALVRAPLGSFQIAVCIGGEWYEAITIKQDDPAIETMRQKQQLEKLPPSPSQIRNKERQAERERESKRIAQYQHEQQQKRVKHRAEKQKDRENA